jgi:O-antigen/teichoic acid export membrane protein
MTAAPPEPRARYRRDLIATYIAVTMKVLSWAIVTALLLRSGSPEQLAVFALLRATVGLLQYTSLGLSPALVRQLTDGGLASRERVRSAYNAALLPAGGLAAIAVVLLGIYGVFIDSIHNLPDRIHPGTAGVALMLLGVGFVLRLWSDVTGAVLQARGRMWMDSLILASGDLLWLVATFVGISAGFMPLTCAAGAFAGSGAVIAIGRLAMVRIGRLAPGRFSPTFDFPTLKFLLLTGSALTLAQLADFLYAPTDMILIEQLIDPVLIAAYTPAVQFDAALLLLVAAIASVSFPQAAIAIATDRADQLRAIWIRGTIASGIILLASAGLLLWFADPILRAWLGTAMPETRAILPWVLIHTVIGGASGVSRAMLIALGRVRAFTIAVLLAAVGNVLLSVLFVAVFEMGLFGIVLGTIVSVVLRCAVWMPWYTHRAIRHAERNPPGPPMIAEPI